MRRALRATKRLFSRPPLPLITFILGMNYALQRWASLAIWMVIFLAARPVARRGWRDRAAFVERATYVTLADEEGRLIFRGTLSGLDTVARDPSAYLEGLAARRAASSN